MADSRTSLRRLGTEAVVIVASILLAFTIDRGYEGYQESTEETAILIGLRADLTASREALERHLAWHGRWEGWISNIQSYLREPGIDRTDEERQEMAIALHMLYSGPTFDPNTAALDLIEASGSGRLISDPELGTLIAEWRVHAEDALEQQRALQRNRESVLWPLLVDLKIAAPRPGGTSFNRNPIPTFDQLRASELDTVVTLYGMLAQVSGDDWRQVLDATDAVLERLRLLVT